MLNLNDCFKYESICLGSKDLISLSQLYLPIIGIDGYSLYMFLNNEYKCNDKNEKQKSVRSVLDYLHLNNIGILEYALNKLEGIGLVKRLTHKTKGEMFVFLYPLEKEYFLKNTLLSNLLIQNIGEVEYEKLLQKQEYPGYKEETKCFDEVYKYDKSNKKDTHIIIDNIPKEIKDNIIVKNSKFDYIVFKMFFDDEKLKSILDDSNVKNEILKISYQYSLSEEEMKQAVIKSINKNNDFKLEDVAYRAGYIYQTKKVNIENTTTEAFPSKTPEEYVVDLTSDENDILSFALNNSISSMLAIMSNGKGSLVDVRNFTNIQERTNLPVEVINVLIFHLTGIKQGENLSISYIEKVAVNWMKAGIKTAKDALIHIRPNITKDKEAKGRTYKKGESLLPDYMKENKTETEVESIKQKDETKSEISPDVLDYMDEVFGKKKKGKK